MDFPLTGLMWVVKRATSLFNSFCSNDARQVASLLLPFFRTLRTCWIKACKSDVTCFSGRQTSDKICQCKKSRSGFFILTKENEELVILKTIMVNYWWKWSLSLFWMQMWPQITASNNDVKLVEARTVHFAWLLDGKSSSRFERINKLDRAYSYSWQCFSLVCTLKHHVTCLFSHQS